VARALSQQAEGLVENEYTQKNNFRNPG